MAKYKATPITPDEVVKAKEKSIPGEVIKAFNDLIIEKWNGSSATIKQKYAISKICTLMNDHMPEKVITSDLIFKSGWLNIEDVFRSHGWNVEYDKPAYCETYDAFFTFTKP